MSDVRATADDMPLADAFAAADSPEAPTLVGRCVLIEASNDVYPHLRLIAREDSADGARMRLYLYEDSHVTPQLYQPIPSVAARIDLIATPAALDALELPEEGSSKFDAVRLRGRIVDTRYAWLQRAQQRLGRLPKQGDDGRIRSQGMRLVNPIAHYHALLWRKRSLTTSIIHGDMNLGNILLGHSLTSDELTAWLIDFDRTGPGGHTVFDAVKLETEYKLHILPHRLRSVDEFIHLETMLHQALIDPAEVLTDLKQHPHLRDAYQFIATIRRLALQNLRTPIDPAEYYLGLLGYGLAALKYANLYGENHQRWLQPYPSIAPLAAAAYLSASFAASFVDQAEGVMVTPDCYPVIQRLAQPLIKAPRLVGRDALLAQAQGQLASDTPVVLLHGPIGSGRDAIARALCSALQRSEYTIWPWPAQPNMWTSVDQLVQVLLAFLHAHGVQDLPPPLEPPPSKLDVGARERGVRQVGEQIPAALERAGEEGHLIALLIHLTQSDSELCAFVAQLASMVRRTALILIADDPITSLSDGIALRVGPLKAEVKLLPFGDIPALQRLRLLQTQLAKED